MKLKTTHFAALAALSLVGSASAATIYSDSLIGSGSALSGTAADTSSAFAGGTAGATWTASIVNETATGAVYSSTGSGGADSAFLPIAITSGFVYTLEATLATTSVSGWTSLGFADSSLNGGWNDGGGTKAAWTLVQASGVGAGPQFFAGPGTTNGFSNANTNWLTTANGTQTVSITLDTTGPLWKTFSTIGGISSNTFTYAANPTITHVGFGQVSADITSGVSAFSLSAVAVPEPSAAILGAFGALAFLRRRRA